MDFSAIREQMTRWWKQCISGGTSADKILEKFWCRGGLGGVVLLLVGLKEWGGKTLGKAGTEKWLNVLLEVKSVLMKIPFAQKL